jgi:hypothetical protein
MFVVSFSFLFVFLPAAAALATLSKRGFGLRAVLMPIAFGALAVVGLFLYFLGSYFLT